ncbi:hypothetical protein F5878DRAFT_664583 [Lentinula raphanica]|uniref:Uncharacterized protein n=1 Tax=Lentinula raphanica TaxID=153919 RepID=A0AA38P1M5_9AGAR|nr:hypothetical protein F5878DRAFT_664583 [Lentinula raphanica]
MRQARSNKQKLYKSSSKRHPRKSSTLSPSLARKSRTASHDEPSNASNASNASNPHHTPSTSLRMHPEESASENEPHNSSEGGDSDISDEAVKAVIKDLTAKSGRSIISGPALSHAVKQSSSSLNKNLRHAQVEANQGFRPAKRGTARTEKGLVKTNKAQTSNEESSLHEISLVVILPWGVEQSVTPNSFVLSEKLDLSIGTIHDLCDTALCIQSTNDLPLYLDSKWSSDDVEKQLLKWLPLPTRHCNDIYFMEREHNPLYPTLDYNDDHTYLPELYLCEKARSGIKPLTGPSVIFPNGQLLWAVACGDGKTPISRRRLIFVARRPIPSETLDTFRASVQLAKKENCTLFTAMCLVESRMEMDKKDKGKGKQKANEDDEDDEDDEDEEDQDDDKEEKGFKGIMDTEIATELESDTAQVGPSQAAKRNHSPRPTKIRKRSRNVIVVSSDDDESTAAGPGPSTMHLRSSSTRNARPAHRSIIGSRRSSCLMQSSPSPDAVVDAPATSNVPVASPPQAKPEFLKYYVGPDESLERIDLWTDL